MADRVAGYYTTSGAAQGSAPNRMSPPALGTTMTSATPRRRLLHKGWGVAVAIAAAGTFFSLVAPRYPHWPEQLPTPWQQAWYTVASLAESAGMRLSDEEVGPVLDRAVRRGELVVAVRHYRPPAPPGSPAPAQPETLDAEYARYLAARLKVGLKLVEASDARHADVALAGIRGETQPPAAQAVPTPYTGGPGAVVVLRNSQPDVLGDLRERAICLAEGSPYRAALAGYGATIRQYPGAIQAIAAFMAGQCEALAEDHLVLTRLSGLPEWRFYRRLRNAVPADNTGYSMALREPDAQSSAWLNRAARAWKSHGPLSTAREHRAGTVAYEVAQLGGGLVCHP